MSAKDPVGPRRAEPVVDRFVRLVTQAAADQKPNEVRNLIYRARKSIARKPDAPWAAALTAQVEQAEARVRAEKDKARAAREKRAAKAAKDRERAKALATPVQCPHCMRDFVRTRPRQQVCPSCRKTRVSLRTISAGLPTLGKRR